MDASVVELYPATARFRLIFLAMASRHGWGLWCCVRLLPCGQVASFSRLRNATTSPLGSRLISRSGSENAIAIARPREDHAMPRRERGGACNLIKPFAKGDGSG